MQAGREIKFRAWDKEQNIMLGPNFDREQYAIISYNGLALLDITREDEDGYDYEMDVEWLQYTGLCDKNGKEIYEGDIINDSFGNQKGIIRYNVYSASFEISEYDGIHLLSSGNSKKFFEVIGNIYESPELLEAI